MLLLLGLATYSTGIPFVAACRGIDPDRLGPVAALVGIPPPVAPLRGVALVVADRDHGRCREPGGVVEHPLVPELGVGLARNRRGCIRRARVRVHRAGCQPAKARDGLGAGDRRDRARRARVATEQGADPEMAVGNDGDPPDVLAGRLTGRARHGRSMCPRAPASSSRGRSLVLLLAVEAAARGHGSEPRRSQRSTRWPCSPWRPTFACWSTARPACATPGANDRVSLAAVELAWRTGRRRATGAASAGAMLRNTGEEDVATGYLACRARVRLAGPLGSRQLQARSRIPIRQLADRQLGRRARRPPRAGLRRRSPAAGGSSASRARGRASSCLPAAPSCGRQASRAEAAPAPLRLDVRQRPGRIARTRSPHAQWSFRPTRRPTAGTARSRSRRSDVCDPPRLATVRRTVATSTRPRL